LGTNIAVVISLFFSLKTCDLSTV